MLDLGKLDDANEFGLDRSGQPRMFRIEDIEEDPDQPRKEFAPDQMQEMAASISERGVKSPISVRTHPTKPGKWMLNFGARRLRGSRLAGKDEIPGFVDEQFDDFDQVVENEQRAALTSLELALFWKKKKAEGVSSSEMARRLSKHKSMFTHLNALIDMPAVIEELYTSGRCQTPVYLYDLRRLHEKFPAEVQAWAESGVDVTRKTISALQAQLTAPPVSEAAPQVSQAPEPAVQASTEGATGASVENFNAPEAIAPAAPAALVSASEPEAAPNLDKAPVPGVENFNEPERKPVVNAPSVKAADQKPVPNDFIESPVLTVHYDGRVAQLILSRRPSDSNHVWVEFADDQSQVEVIATDCTVASLSGT